MRRLLTPFLALASVPLLPSCSSTDIDPAAAARNEAIRREPTGDHYYGRRYFSNHRRFWGYLRRPGQLWEEGQLVIMREDGVLTPDRLSEDPASGGRGHGYDHNVEYRVRGRFTGRTVYDPNADLELPEFAPTGFEKLNGRPGFLFSPNERYDPRYIPAREMKRTTPERM